VSVFKQRWRIVVLSEFVVAHHVQIRMPAINCVKEFRTLRCHRAHQQSAIASTADSQLFPRRVLVVDQPFCRGNKVIKHVLLFVQHACMVPFLSEFATTAKIWHRVESALLYPPRNERVETGREAHVKAAVAIEDGGNVTVWSQAFAMDQKHRHLGAIFRLVPDLLACVPVRVKGNWVSKPELPLA